MRFSQQVLIAAVATTAMVVSAGAAMAHGNTMNMFAPALHNYSGAWPVTVTRSQFSNGTPTTATSARASSKMTEAGRISTPVRWRSA